MHGFAGGKWLRQCGYFSDKGEGVNVLNIEFENFLFMQQRQAVSS